VGGTYADQLAIYKHDNQSIFKYYKFNSEIPNSDQLTNEYAKM